MTNDLALTIIIVTYNSSRHISECVDSLLDGTPGLRVLIVDNDSRDDTVQQISGRTDTIVVANKENVGFSRAVNQALAMVPAEQPVLLLNPDARIAGSEVRRLLDVTLQNPDCGLAAPLVRQTQDLMDVVHGGRVPTVWRMFTHQTGLSRLASRVRAFEGHYARFDAVLRAREAYEVDWVSGGCMLISSKARQVAPRLDETWFMYAEDIEYCWRVQRHGMRVCIHPRIEARHEVGGSRNRDARASSEWLLNLYDFYKRDLSRGPASARLWRFVVCMGLVGRAAAFRLRSMRRRSSRELRSYWRQTANDFWGYAIDLATRR